MGFDTEDIDIVGRGESTIERLGGLRECFCSRALGDISCGPDVGSIGTSRVSVCS